MISNIISAYLNKAAFKQSLNKNEKQKVVEKCNNRKKDIKEENDENLEDKGKQV